MTSKSMRSFAGGLLVAAGLCGAVYFSSSDKADTEETLSEDEMKSLLSTDGYVIHTEEEWEDQLAEVETSKDKVDTDKETETKEKIIYRSVLKVSKGMTSIDVGKTLKRAKIIKNSKDFSDKVEKKGLANGLRPGTYVIDSDMSTDKIISIIFK